MADAASHQGLGKEERIKVENTTRPTGKLDYR